MSNKTINFNTPVELNDVPNLIATIGATRTILLRGEPGIGKSTVLKNLETILGNGYDYIYVDCPVMDVSDIVMRIPNHETKTLESYVSELFKMDSPKPKVIMLDEMSKANKLLQVIFTRLTLERSVGDSKLPADSIVFITGNNSSDGVGDTLSAHVLNRLCVINVRKPDARRWGVWATDNGISRQVRAWVAMNSNCLASYLDGGQESNPYIFNPTKPITSFVTPRSLVGADNVVKNANKLGSYVTQAALAGLCGSAFAESIAAFMSMERELISTKDVIANPETVQIPEKAAALFQMMFNAVDTIETQDDLSAFMIFVKRIPSDEVKSCFYSMAYESKRTAKLARNNNELREWGANNLPLLM
jgi:energy-coupling factor transporter ATP-binding protein EcfA2